jgi:hypothetical protein
MHRRNKMSAGKLKRKDYFGDIVLDRKVLLQHIFAEH